jgi:hypothetical protein
MHQSQNVNAQGRASIRPEAAFLGLRTTVRLYQPNKPPSIRLPHLSPKNISRLARPSRALLCVVRPSARPTLHRRGGHLPAHAPILRRAALLRLAVAAIRALAEPPHSGSPLRPSPAHPTSCSPVAATACTALPLPRRHQEKVVTNWNIVSRDWPKTPQ